MSLLGTTHRPLIESHDLLMLDLDGVVYVGGRQVDGVEERLRRARAAGSHVAFVTNNASRTPEQVADKLTGMGVAAASADVVTSAQAAARLVRSRFGPGATVLLLGGGGLEAAIRAEGLGTTRRPEDADVLVSGYGPDVVWRDVMRAATAVRDGLPYVASNTDLTIPTESGIAPGHGVLVATIAEFAGVVPEVAGKPARPLLDETIRRVGGERPLMIGDRLDTDIEGAHAVGVDSLLVLTGVSGLEDLVAAAPRQRPTYISPDLEGLFEAHAAPTVDGDRASHGGWQAVIEAGSVRVSGRGSLADWWRVIVTAAWVSLDTRGSVVDVTNLLPPSGPGPAEQE